MSPPPPRGGGRRRPDDLDELIRRAQKRRLRVQKKRRRHAAIVAIVLVLVVGGIVAVGFGGAAAFESSCSLSELRPVSTGPQGGPANTFVYAAKKVAPKLDASSPRFAAMHAQAAQYFANQTAAAFMEEYVTREQQRAEAKAR